MFRYFIDCVNDMDPARFVGLGIAIVILVAILGVFIRQHRYITIAQQCVTIHSIEQCQEYVIGIQAVQRLSKKCNKG